MKWTLTVFSVIFTAMTLAVPAQRPGERGGNHPNVKGGRPSVPVVVARSEPVNRDVIDRVNRVETTIDRLLSEAKKMNRDHRPQREAYQAIVELERTSDRFRDLALDRRGRPSALQDIYNELARDFDRVEDTMRSLRSERAVQRYYRELAVEMDGLERTMGRQRTYWLADCLPGTNPNGFAQRIDDLAGRLKGRGRTELSGSSDRRRSVQERLDRLEDATEDWKRAAGDARPGSDRFRDAFRKVEKRYDDLASYTGSFSSTMRADYRALGRLLDQVDD